MLLSATMTREMAWQKRYRGGTAGKLWSTRRATGVRAPRRRPRRQHRRADAGRRPDRLPLRPRGLGQPLLLAAPTASGLRRHTDHGPTARVLRPPRRHRRHPRRLRVGRASSGCSTTSTAEPAPARRPARRPAHRPRSRYRISAARLAGPRPPDRTGRSSVVERPRHRALAHPPRRPRPRAARQPGRAGPAAAAPLGRGPGGVGRRRATARTPCASPRSTRAPPTRRGR